MTCPGCSSWHCPTMLSPPSSCWFHRCSTVLTSPEKTKRNGGSDPTLYMGCARMVKAATIAVAAVWLVGPTVVGVVSDELPRAHAAAATWLTPPYLYLVINAIILSIAASSRFQTSRAAAAPAAANEGPENEPLPSPAMEMEKPAPAVQTPEPVAVEEPERVVKTDEEEEFLISRSTWTPVRREADVAREVEEAEVPPFADLTNSREKPLVSARFGRKAAKPSPEGSRALRVARPRREETLESTWKAITEGRAPPLARHLKKSDTWTTRSRRPSGGEEAAPAPAPAMRKADTFDEGRRVRREPSLGQDELNRRVEAFINKFNMEMRLQRQESLKHYKEMVDKASHYN